MHLSVFVVFLCLLGIVQSASAPCPNGEQLVECNEDVCSRFLCLYPSDLKCKPNYCGECTRVWYSGDEPATCWVEDIKLVD